MPCMQLEVSQQPLAATPVPLAPPCMRRHARKQTTLNAQGKVKKREQLLTCFGSCSCGRITITVCSVHAQVSKRATNMERQVSLR